MMEKIPEIELREDQTRLMRYDFLMWHLGGRMAPRGHTEIAVRVGMDPRALFNTERRAMEKMRRNPTIVG